MGRRPFTPTDEQRRMARAMAGFGVPHDDIALIVGCSPPTLRKRFRTELSVGAAEAIARVTQTLFAMATSGVNTAATIFFLKARAGWREKQPTDIAVERPDPLVIHLAPLPPEEMDEPMARVIGAARPIGRSRCG